MKLNINITSTARKVLLPAATLLVAAAGFTSCDDVPEDERYIKVERPAIKRRVLVQEFTGQGCINCPTGAALIHSLQEQNPGSIISVNLHPENTQYTRPIGGLKLTSPIATAYFGYYHPSTLPAAVVDGASPLTNTSLWTDAILKALEQTAPADLDLATEYDAATRELKVTYTAHFNDVYQAPLAINIWITESNIVGPQYSGANIVRDYVHNHVLRASLTGDWGEEIGKAFIPEDEITRTYTCTIPAEWDASNCGVVGFLQNPGSKAVEQSAEAHVAIH